MNNDQDDVPMDGDEAAPDSASDQDPDVVEVDDDTIEAMNAQ